MKNQKKSFGWIVGLALLSSAGLSGCVDIGTPRSTVESAGQAVQALNLKEFRETLRGNALEKFGTDTEMRRLNETLSAYKKVKAGASTLLSEEVNPERTRIRQLHSTEILAGNSSAELRPVFVAQVECVKSYECEPVVVCRPHSPIGCDPFTRQECRWMSLCGITDLALP